MGKFDLHKNQETEGSEEVYSKPVRAGKRTYFFDVKATRNNDYFLTITESRRVQSDDGSFCFDKHKIHLYKEDFGKFAEGLQHAVDFIKERNPDFFADGDGKGYQTIDEEFDSL